MQPELINKIQDFITLFKAIIIEAYPFVILGTIVSVIVGLFVKETFIKKILPKNDILSHFILTFLGMLMPVCECGNIPVGRRLLQIGLKPSQVVSFLFAAPIINPITILSTIEAFAFDPKIIYIRILAGICIPFILGYILSKHKDQQSYITKEFKQVCEHRHDDDDKSLFTKATSIFTDEFWSVFKMLVFGAFIAALSQVFIPRSIINSVAQDPVLGTFAMIALGFIISICSNVDAFFALAYANTFKSGSISAFLISGPMIDIKILSMLKSIFTTKVLIFMVLFTWITSAIIGIIVNKFL